VTPRRLLCGILGALGLALYLWPALSAPVVLWSDSTIDLEWARTGELWPPRVGTHVAKPAYLLFLRAALASGPAGAPRRIVVAQSLIAWLAIVVAAFVLGRRLGWRWGIALCATLFLFLRLRDASSAVMPDTLAAALLLLIVVALMTAPGDGRMALALGLATAVLFFVRPNVGAIALCLGVAALWIDSRRRSAILLLGGFAALCLPVWILSSPPGALQKGLAYPSRLASADYFWDGMGNRTAAASSAPPPSAIENWRATARTSSSPDTRRQLVWRALHGLFGLEFYDSGWSQIYGRLRVAAALLSPCLLFGALAVLLAAPSRGEARVPRALGLLLLALTIVQSLVLGALPRFVLPLVPSLLLLAIAALPGLLDSSPLRRGVCVVLFAALAGFTAWQRQILDWEWGIIEAPGVRITQTIPARALPDRAPATLHVRIAAPLLPTAAGLQLRGPSGETLYDSGEDPLRQRPFVTVSLPDALLAANQRGPVKLDLVSRGTYDATHYLLFPVIPPPWGPAARREGSRELSPSSGVESGSLDWWAHPGAEQ
jgi:hypothetical protein